MANNRGDYDPRQFLHYPEKDPFSDAAQRRLDGLIKDFLSTGIAFVNGAGLRDIDVVHRKEGGDIPNRQRDDVTRQEQETFGNGVVTALGDDEVEEFGSQFSRVDKGKGRDEREGPGLKGLWNSTTHFSPGTSSPGASVDDGASFLTDNGSLELEGSGIDSDDRDGFFEGAYENEQTEELEVDDEKEDSDGIGFAPGHSRSPGSEHEIICIGDSEEEDEPLEAASDLGSDEAFRNERKWYHGDVPDGNHAPDVDWGSGSVSEEATDERQESDKAWDYSVSKQYEDNNAQEPEWHQSQGKESDDEDGGFITRHGELEGDERDEKDNSHPPEQPRRFFTSASRSDPWENLSTAVSESGPPVLFPAHWDVTSFQQPTVERQKDVFDGTEDIRVTSFDSVRDDLNPDLTDDAEANEQGPPPELQHDGHVESLSSFTRGEPDLARIAYLQPIPKPNRALSEHGSQSLETSGLSSGAGVIHLGHAVDDSNVKLTHYSDLPTEPSASQDLGDADQPFRSSPSARELSLDPEIQVTQNLDVFQVVSTTHGSADLHALESTSALQHSTPGGLEHVPQPTDISTVEEQASQEYIERSAAIAPPIESFLRGAFPEERHNSQEPVNPPDVVEKTHDTEEYQNLSTSAPSDVLLPAELHPLQAHPLPDVLASQPPFTHSSPFAEEDSNEDLPIPVLLHPAVFDDHVPTHTEAQSQSPTFAISSEYADYDVEIYDMVEDVVGNEVVVVQSVSEHEDDAHEVQDVPLETLETEEVTEHHPGDVFSRYVVSEAMSDVSAVRTGTASPPAALKEGAHSCGSEGAMPSISAPTISIGSNTPPLSPTATVTNSSSAPDPSIATSDLSTVNQASVSVVTSTGSPPAIHVPRVSATHADIRQPVLTYVGYASDEDHMGGDGESVLPDPRLPPEPTHLGIPVGVVGRSLRDDKEERAESMKVEPPRSESEGGSMVGEARNICEAEGTSPTIPAVADEVRESLQKDVVQHEVFEQVVEDEGVSTSHGGQEANEAANVPIPSIEERQQKDRDKVTDDDELVYPDSASDRLGADGDEKPVSQPFGVDCSNFAVGERSLRSPPASPTASKSWIDTPSSAQDTVAAVIPSIEVLPEPSTVDLADRGVSDHLEDLNSGAETLIHHKQNGTGTKQLSHSPPGKGLSASDVADSGLAPSTPELCSVSPVRSRKSARGKSKTIAADGRSVSPPPPPQSTIYAHHTKRSPALQKRLRPSDPPPGSSKYPRLTLSAPSNKPNGDATSTSGALDDKSDVSSNISSASAVSRLLVQRGTSSSPSIPSRSPSIKSQLSPTTADHGFMLRTPIRRYVPHKHNTPPTNPRRPSVERAPSVHQSSVSPSPTSPLGPSFVPLTPTHQTRASCTDHKISIPGPESLLYFLVPRCSLLDPEVEKDVNIVDCGVATKDEVDRAIGDLEAVNLDSTTLGVIRQLAGIQLMREGQVGYLPDDFSRKHVKHASPRIHNAPPTHGLSHKLSPNVPSGAGSSQLASYEAAPSPVSVSGSVLSDMSEAEVDTLSKLSKVSRADDEAYEMSSEDEAAADVEVESFTSPLSSMPSPTPKSVRLPRVSAWRRRKLKPEDGAYKPEVETAESSSDNESIGGKKKGRRASKRKPSEAFIPGDGNAGNHGTPPPKKKRKRKDAGPSDVFDEPLDGTETRRKQARRKKADDRHTGDHVATAV